MERTGQDGLANAVSDLLAKIPILPMPVQSDREPL
jgi:hypothetical protein